MSRRINGPMECQVHTCKLLYRQNLYHLLAADTQPEAAWLYSECRARRFDGPQLGTQFLIATAC
jgi:hypothetical protein